MDDVDKKSVDVAAVVTRVGETPFVLIDSASRDGHHPRMVGQLACLLCAVDPQATSMLVPMAQAGLIAAPIVFRKELLRAAKWVRRGDPIADDDPSIDERDEPASGPVAERDLRPPLDE